MPENRPPTCNHVGITDAIYTAAHKALCSLAFALQEVNQPQNEKDTSHAQPTKRETEEEAAQLGQHLCDNGKPSGSLSNGTTAHIARKRPARPLRATVIVIPVPK